MPHSYGASFSGVGFFGPSTPDSPIDVRANPAPRAIMIRMDSQLCIVDQVRLVNKFPSLHANTWSLVVGRWSLVVSRWSFVLGPDQSPTDDQRPMTNDPRTNDQRPMTTLRLAWFSPLPPARSGVASYTAELVPLLQHELAIEC